MLDIYCIYPYIITKPDEKCFTANIKTFYTNAFHYSRYVYSERSENKMFVHIVLTFVKI